MLADADALDFRVGGRNLMTERGVGNQLTWHEHLEVDPEVALARYRVCTVGHEPQHPFRAYIASREAQACGGMNGRNNEYPLNLGPDQANGTLLHVDDECGL